MILYHQQDVAAQVREITQNEGCAAVFDGVGRATWQGSLNSVRRRGLVISYGNASGPVDGVNLSALNAAGSAFVTRPKISDYYTTPEERAAGAARLFEMVLSGAIKIEIATRRALKDVADAHRATEAGETVGSTILIP